MADIVLTGDTSGAITIAAPDVSGTNTLTLPASTGTMITSATAAADVPKPTALSTASGSAPSYSARAWVNFNGTGVVAIRDSGNVSSITDVGTGKFTANFTTAFPNANYVLAGSAGNHGASTSSTKGIQPNGAWTTSACAFSVSISSTYTDDSYIGMSFFN